MLPHDDCFKEIIQMKVHNFSLIYSGELKISNELKCWSHPSYSFRAVKHCSSSFIKTELRAVFLFKRSEILTWWYRCLCYKTDCHKCQQLASLLAASEKQPNSWRLNKSPAAQVDPSRSGLKHICGPCRGICSAPVTPFIMLLWLATYTNGSEKL